MKVSVYATIWGVKGAFVGSGRDVPRTGFFGRREEGQVVLYCFSFILSFVNRCLKLYFRLLRTWVKWNIFYYKVKSNKGNYQIFVSFL